MEAIDRDHFRLSTGREIYANCGIIGMSPAYAERDGDYNDSLPYGYDGAITVNERWSEPEEYWTAAEQHELADYMITLWQRWKSAVVGSGTQASSEALGNTRRSAAQDSPSPSPSSAALSVEQAKSYAIGAALSYANARSQSFTPSQMKSVRAELDRAFDALILAAQSDHREQARAEIERLTKEVERLTVLTDIAYSSKSPCGHWQAYAVLMDPKGAHITCLQCRVEAAESSLTVARAARAVEMGCEQDGSVHRYTLREDACDCGIIESAPVDDARAAREQGRQEKEQEPLTRSGQPQLRACESDLRGEDQANSILCEECGEVENNWRHAVTPGPAKMTGTHRYRPLEAK